MPKLKSIAPWTNGAGSYGLSADIRAAGGAWHVWRNTQGRIICNGPTMESRCLDCVDIDSAIGAIWQCGAHDAARALQQVKESGGAFMGWQIAYRPARESMKWEAFKPRSYGRASLSFDSLEALRADITARELEESRA